MPRPDSIDAETLWIDDATDGAVSGDAGFDDTQVASGALALHVSPPMTSDVRIWSVSNATPMTIASDDELVIYALVNPCNPPRQILMSWSDGTSEYRASWGESRIEPLIPHEHVGSIPGKGAWARLNVVASSLGIPTNTSLSGLSISVDGGEAWFDAIGKSAASLQTIAPPTFIAGERVWFDDAIPAGAVNECTNFGWTAEQAASGSMSYEIPDGSSLHQYCFRYASDPMELSVDDVIVTYVLIDPQHPPRELMLQWHDGSNWNNRAYWGEDLLGWGASNSVQRRNMGPLPEAGEWVRLEVPAASK